MSEPTVSTPGQVAGTTPGSAPVPAQPATPAGNGTETAGQEGAESQYLTREEANKLREDILNESRSYSDKGRIRVEKAVQAATNSIAELRALGREITPAEEKELLAAATQKAMTTPEPAPDGTQPSQTAPQGQPDPEILAIQREAGVELYDGDPELDKLDRTHGIRKFYASVEVAANAKKARLASQPIDINPAARLPAVGSPANGLPIEMPARDAWGQVQHKK